MMNDFVSEIKVCYNSNNYKIFIQILVNQRYVGPYFTRNKIDLKPI